MAGEQGREHQADSEKVGSDEKTEEREREPASMLAPHAQSAEAERKDEREEERRRREHDPHPPVVLREETPVVPGTGRGKCRVGDRGSEDERYGLAPRVVLRLLELIVVHP